MSGMCGWLGASEQTRDANEVLRRMSVGLPTLALDEHVASDAQSGLLCRRTSDGPCVATSGGISVAIDGYIDDANGEPQDGAAARSAARNLLDAYRDTGPGCLDRINGEYAVAIIDTEARRLLLATDRMGSRPLAYAKLEGFGLVFGSTVEAIRSHPNVDARLDPQGIFNYAYFHEVPSPTTVYRDLYKLRPGEYLLLDSGICTVRAYWTPAFTESRDVPAATFEADIRRALKSAVASRIESGSTATFLSGGLDSSTIAGFASEIVPGKFVAYTMGFDAAGYDEMYFARLAAKHFDLELREYYVTHQDIVDAMPTIAAEYDEPFGNSSAVPTLMLARLARADGVRRILAGDGGDELFGGNERYAKQKLYQPYEALPGLLREKLIEPVASELPGLFPFGKIRSYVAQASIPMPARTETYNLLNRQPLDSIFAPEFLQDVDHEEPLRLQTERYESAIAKSLVNRMIWLDWKFTLADNDFRKVTRSCEAGGLVVDYPFLSDSLVDIALRMPPADKVRVQTLRHMYKNAFRDFLPAEIIDKSKHGFGLPFGVWLARSNAIQDFLYPLIESLGRRGIFRPDFLTHLIQANRTEHAAFYGNFVYVFAMLELWLDAHNAEL